MSDLAKAKFSAGWTEPEKWAWEKIAAGEPADFNARDGRYYIGSNVLDPCNENGWTENRRLRVKFLQDILTKKVFADDTPDAGVRILGALVDNAPLNLEHARLRRLIWLEHSRILTDVKCRSLRVDGEFSLEGSFVGGRVDLRSASIDNHLVMGGATFEGKGATFEGKVDLNSAKVGGAAFLRYGATFKAEVDLIGADIGFDLDMEDSTFEGKVDLSSAKVGGSAYLRKGALRKGGTFKDEVDLIGADIGFNLVMDGSTFEGKVNLNSAKVGGSAFLRKGATFKAEVDLIGVSIDGHLDMSGATFEGKVDLDSAKVGGMAFLREGATFKEVNLQGADIGSDLDFSDASITGRVNMTGCQVKGEFRLVSFSFRHEPARWKSTASLVLRNAQVGALQDWWRNPPGQSWWGRWWGQVAAFFRRALGPRRARGASLAENSWPTALELEGFTFNRLGGLSGTGKGADMMHRDSNCYVEWLGTDLGSSAQPYEHLASLFRRAGDPGKANALLFAARERQRRLALSGVDNWGLPKDREVLRGVGLWMLRWTIGYGLGNRYFLVLLWVGGWSLLGMFVLRLFGTQSPALWSWLSLFFASLDQLLPIITLNKAYDVLIFGDPSANIAQPPWVLPQPTWVQYYFYVHMMVGWALGSFIVAGLAGLTQRN